MQSPSHLSHGKSLGALLATRLRSQHDGLELLAYEGGPPGADGVVLLNPFGLRMRETESLAKALAEDHRVVTWEMRGGRSPHPDCAALDCSLAAHISDLQSVLIHFGVGRSHLLGYCSGAFVALKAAAVLGPSVLSLTLGNGVYGWADGYPATDLQKLTLKFQQKVASSMAAARFVRQLVLATPHGAHARGGAECDEFRSVMETIYETPATLFCTVRSLLSLREEDVAGLARAVTAPALVLAGGRDERAHPHNGTFIAGLLSGASLRLYPCGDHFELLRPTSEAVADVRQHLRAHRSPLPGAPRAMLSRAEIAKHGV